MNADAVGVNEQYRTLPYGSTCSLADLTTEDVTKQV